MIKKIGHIHVWDKDNKGDFAIVLSVKEVIYNYFKENNIEIIFEDFPMECLKENENSETVKKLNDCDLIIIGGGGVYYKYFLPFNEKLIDKINKPIVIFGVGYIKEIGGLDQNYLEQKSLAFLNNKAEIISVRDFETKRYLESIGVNKKINIIGDPAILLREEYTNIIGEDKSEIRVGLNLNYSGWLDFGKYENVILESYNQVIKKIEEKYANCNFYYLLHHPGEKNIFSKLNTKNKLKIIDLPPNQQKFVYSKLDLIIGMMLHSVVLSFGANTPEINIGYDIRNKSFAEFINFEDLHISVKNLTPELLSNKALEVLENKNNYKEKFSIKKEEIKKLHINILKEIKNKIL